MIESNDEELKELCGGTTITGTIMNGVVNLIKVLYEAGKSTGSSIRRMLDDNLCPLK